MRVRTIDPQHEEQACRILKEHAAADVHPHDVPGPLRQPPPRRGKVIYGLLEFLAGA